MPNLDKKFRFSSIRTLTVRILEIEKDLKCINETLNHFNNEAQNYQLEYEQLQRQLIKLKQMRQYRRAKAIGSVV